MDYDKEACELLSPIITMGMGPVAYMKLRQLAAQVLEDPNTERRKKFVESLKFLSSL